MAKPPSRLGRGLSALIPPRPATLAAPPTPASVAESAAGAIRSIATDRIRPNPRQPRSRFSETALEELTQSIRNNGVLQPIIVRPADDGIFELIAGERRWRAAKRAGIESVPALVRPATDVESLELALVENLQREDLGPLERATGYQQYIDAFDVTVEQLAMRIAESRANVANYIRLLKLPQELQDMVSNGELAMGQARAIAGITDPQRQLAVARLAARRNLSARQVEALARNDTPQTLPPPPIDSAKRHFAHVEESLSKALGLPVQLLPGKKKNSGRVIITYRSLEDFDRIAEKLGGDTHLE
jgi:ParB family chromosome partitioning protein